MFRALIVSATTASVKRAMYTVKDTGMVGVDTVRYGAMCTVRDMGMVGVDKVRYDTMYTVRDSGMVVVDMVHSQGYGHDGGGYGKIW